MTLENGTLKTSTEILNEKIAQVESIENKIKDIFRKLPEGELKTTLETNPRYIINNEEVDSQVSELIPADDKKLLDNYLDGLNDLDLEINELQ